MDMEATQKLLPSTVDRLPRTNLSYRLNSTITIDKNKWAKFAHYLEKDAILKTRKQKLLYLRENKMHPVTSTTTIFQAQSFSDTYLLSNKPPTKDGIYPSYRGFFQGCEITLKRKSMKSDKWAAIFTKDCTTATAVASGNILAMCSLLDQMTDLGI